MEIFSNYQKTFYSLKWFCYNLNTKSVNICEQKWVLNCLKFHPLNIDIKSWYPKWIKCDLVFPILLILPNFPLSLLSYKSMQFTQLHISFKTLINSLNNYLKKCACLHYFIEHWSDFIGWQVMLNNNVIKQHLEWQDLMIHWIMSDIGEIINVLVFSHLDQYSCNL